MNSCYNCTRLIKQTESWEMPHIMWWECRYNHARENLRSFPYRNTKCAGFKKKEPAKSNPELDVLFDAARKPTGKPPGRP